MSRIDSSSWSHGVDTTPACWKMKVMRSTAVAILPNFSPVDRRIYTKLLNLLDSGKSLDAPQGVFPSPPTTNRWSLLVEGFFKTRITCRFPALRKTKTPTTWSAKTCIPGFHRWKTSYRPLASWEGIHHGSVGTMIRNMEKQTWKGTHWIKHRSKLQWTNTFKWNLCI